MESFNKPQDTMRQKTRQKEQMGLFRRSLCMILIISLCCIPLFGCSEVGFAKLPSVNDALVIPATETVEQPYEQPYEQLREQLREQPYKETIMWNGLEVTRENPAGYGSMSVLENVLMTNDSSITFFIDDTFEYEYGETQVVQVNLDGIWYTLPFELAQSDKPLIKGAYNTVDLSVVGKLPPGKYRLLISGLHTRLQWRFFAPALFWVIEPGDARPPESETSGPLRMEDIVLYVQSPFEARRTITDKDNILSLHLENLSGKLYHATNAVLERREGDNWVNVSYQHASLSLLLTSWTNWDKMLYLNEPLAAGNYRLILSISLFNTSDALDYVYEFAVVPYGDVSEPQWDTSRLSPSPLVPTDQSVDITMRIENSVLNEGNTSLVLAITSRGTSTYEFGVAYGVEVLLDGKWYSVPFAHGAFTLQAIVASPGSTIELNVGPVFQCGVLPAGQYRLVKSFDLRDQSSSVVTFLANEYAFVEFTVEKTLDSALLS